MNNMEVFKTKVSNTPVWRDQNVALTIMAQKH